jgi:NAD(P)-dependent dehydrogenase (short-subunit alcohol dehydrogenase family)
MIQGKVILIVGGSSGIGRSIAKLAVREGAAVTVASRSAVKRQAEITTYIGDVSTLEVDITSEASIKGMLEKIRHIDHLVVTAKEAVKIIPFKNSDINDVKKSFETKFWGQYRLVKLAASQMNQGSSVILTSGITSQRPYPGLSAMSLINGATESLCRALAIELAPIRVNVVSPGFVESNNKNIQKMAKRFPLKGLGSSEEIAKIYIFLMQQTYSTGTITVSDGGASHV